MKPILEEEVERIPLLERDISQIVIMFVAVVVSAVLMI